jgi:hypothetical protein
MARKPMKKVKKSAQNYRDNPKSKAKKAEYDTAYHATPERKKYRAGLAKKRRAAGIMGKGGKDVSHTKGGGTTKESPSKNRARQGSGNNKKKK